MGNDSDPYLLPQTSTGNKLARVAWGLAYTCLFRTSPRPMHAWRAFLLRCFGAKIGPEPRIYPGCKIWAPWNLVCEDLVAVADGATIYNPSRVFLGSHSILSQDSYLCGATHDPDDEAFPLISKPISVSAYAWICARATVLPGVSVGEGSVLGLGSVATADLDPWTIYGGIPAKKIRPRQRRTLQPTPVQTL